MSSTSIPKHFLHDVAHYFSPLKGFPHSVIYYDDGIIQTDHGCYRLALEKTEDGKNYVALFYGRDPSDLEIDPYPTEDGSNILHKDRVVLVEMREIHQTNIDDHPLNVGWVPGAIARTEHDLSIANLPEACLHRITDDLYVSKFFTYKVNGEPGKRRITVTSRIHSNGEVVVPQDGLPLDITLERAEKEIAGQPGRTVEVVVDFSDDNADGDHIGNHILNSFPDELVPAIILRDQSVYINRLWAGHDPQSAYDDPATLLFRAKEALGEYMNGWGEALQDREKLARKVLPLLANIAIAGAGGAILHGVEEVVKTTLTDKTLERVAEIGGHGETERVPAERFDLVNVHFPRAHKAQSEIHDAVMRCNPEGFGTLNWITNPTKLAFATKHTHVQRDERQSFAFWLSTYLTNPRKTIWSYYSETGEDTCRAIYRDDCIAIGQASNGIRVVYDRDPGNADTGKLYVYYHCPKILPSLRKLIPDAIGHFDEDRVIIIDTAKREAAWTTCSFAEFKDKLPSGLRPILDGLPSPQRPPDEAFNLETPAPKEATKVTGNKTKALEASAT